MHPRQNHRSFRVISPVLLLLFICSASTAATADSDRTAAVRIDGIPFELKEFDGSLISDSPRLFFTPAQIARARSRIAEHRDAKRLMERYLADVEKHFAVEIEPLDESWWQTVKDKPWSETYPIIAEQTMREPMRVARAAGELATASLLVDDPRYAERAERLLMSLASYTFVAEHYDVGMNYSIWMWQVLKAYDVLAPTLSGEQRHQLDGLCTRFARALAHDDVFWIDNNIGGGINNHLAWHKALFGLLGLFYDRPELVEYCLHGRRGFVPLLEDGLLDHGLWCESSLNYQFAAIAPMLAFGMCQRNMNHAPSILDITAANGRTLKQSFDAMFDVLAPNGLIPPIGDAYGRHVKLWEISLYETAWAAWGDPKVAWLMQQNPEASLASLFAPPMPDDVPAPPIRTMNLPEHGYALLRSHRDAAYWNNPAARLAFVTYDRSGVHANADKLSLMLFAGEQMVLPDVEGRATVYHAFSSRIQRELNRGTISHNTVMIDGQDQRMSSQMLPLIEFRDLPAEKRVTVADLDGVLYDGVRQMRTVAMTEHYVLDVFQVNTGDATRRIDWIAHTLDEHASLMDPDDTIKERSTPFTFPQEGPTRWLRDARSISNSGELSLSWKNETSALHMTMLDPQADQIILCGYPATDEPETPTIPMMIVRRHADRALFAAVWSTAEKRPDIRIIPRGPREKRLHFEVFVNGQTRRHFVPDLKYATGR